MTKPKLRKKVMDFITEAVNSGARLFIACKEVDISTRTYNRWIEAYNELKEHVDKRTIAIHKEPHNKLSQEEKQNGFTPSYKTYPARKLVGIHITIFLIEDINL